MGLNQELSSKAVFFFPLLLFSFVIWFYHVTAGFGLGRLRWDFFRFPGMSRKGVVTFLLGNLFRFRPSPNPAVTFFNAFSFELIFSFLP